MNSKNNSMTKQVEVLIGRIDMFEFHSIKNERRVEN